MENNNINEENISEVKETEVEELTEISAEESTEVETEEAEQKEEKAPYDGPSVTVSTRYDYTTLKYFNVMSMVYKKHYPILYIALALFCVGYDAFYFFKTIYPTIQNDTFEARGLLLPGIFLVFAAYSIYLFFNFEKSIDKNLTMHFNQYPEVSSVQAKVTLEGITVTSSKNVENPYTYDWIYITQITEINQYYYFFAGRQPIIVSKDPNNILEGDAETLKAIIDEQITKKPYKKIEKEILKTPVTYVHREDMNVENVASEPTNDAVVEDVTEEVKENNESEE